MSLGVVDGRQGPLTTIDRIDLALPQETVIVLEGLQGTGGAGMLGLEAQEVLNRGTDTMLPCVLDSTD